MSLLSRVTSVSALVAFALASQGCATTVTRSSSIEPVMNAAGTPGRGPDDTKTQADRPQQSERHVVEHASALAHDRHGVRTEFCRRCSAN